jgi:hypothetical protein
VDPITQILAHLTRLERKVDALSEKPKAGLTRVKFGKLAGMHPNTVARKISTGLIRTEKGRIPYSELSKWTSHHNQPAA